MSHNTDPKANYIQLLLRLAALRHDLRAIGKLIVDLLLVHNYCAKIGLGLTNLRSWIMFNCLVILSNIENLTLPP